MGVFKKFDLFCTIHQLRPINETPEGTPGKINEASWRAFKADQLGLSWRDRDLPEIEDDRDLTWDEIDALTGGTPGTHHTPCPYCGADKELSTRFKIERTLVRAKWYCFYCSAQGSVENQDGDVPDAEELAAAQKLVAEQRAEKQAYALRLWDECETIKADSTGMVYLKARRLEPPPNPDAVMRWHPQCPFGKTKQPCIVSLFRNAITDAPTGIHRTYIYSATSGMAQRMALGGIARSAIKLWPLGDSDTLAVGEGIENVLSAVKLGVATPPAWATSVANNLSRLPLIESVRHLVIAADNDASGTGIEAATKLYHTYNRDGRNAVIKHTRVAGTDFNDLLREGADR